jgi:hypothetical protein
MKGLRHSSRPFLFRTDSTMAVTAEDLENRIVYVNGDYVAATFPFSTEASFSATAFMK